MAGNIIHDVALNTFSTAELPAGLEDFLNIELLDSFQTLLPLFFCTGFAAATLLILITFGIFKAFSFLRIRN